MNHYSISEKYLMNNYSLSIIFSATLNILTSSIEQKKFRTLIEYETLYISKPVIDFYLQQVFYVFHITFCGINHLRKASVHY